MKWQSSVAEAVKLMLGYGSNKSLNIKCAKWFDQKKTKKNKKKNIYKSYKNECKIIAP